MRLPLPCADLAPFHPLHFIRSSCCANLQRENPNACHFVCCCRFDIVHVLQETHELWRYAVHAAALRSSSDEDGDTERLGRGRRRGRFLCWQSRPWCSCSCPPSSESSSPLSLELSPNSRFLWKMQHSASAQHTAIAQRYVREESEHTRGLGDW
jgi:hypothetical protein